MNLHKKFTQSSLVALLATFWSVAALADAYFVEPATGPGATATDLATMTELIKSAVTGGAGGGATLSEDASKADYVLKTKLLRLGQSLVVSMQKTSEGKVRHSAEMKASKVEELDLVADRLTRAVVTNSAVTDDLRVVPLTEEEAAGGNDRRPSHQGYYVGVGPALFSGTHSGNIATYLTGGKFWDVKNFMVKLGGEVAFSNEANFVQATLGGTYFLSQTTWTPYVSVDFGLGAVHVASNGETAGGFLAGAGTGIQFLRTTNINLDLGFRANALLRSVSTGLPVVYGVRLAFYF